MTALDHANRVDGLDDHPLAMLREFVQSARTDGASERCGMCAAPIAPQHRHLVDLSDRSILCMCTPCHLLFDEPGSGSGRFVHVPSRYLDIAGFDVGDAEWDDLQIPVSLAFFFHNSDQERMVAFYPGPAGATESLLPLDAWAAISSRHPIVEEIVSDVEAVLVRRTPERTEAYIIPIDRCYELTGRLRMHWSGFDGGKEAHQEIDAFFDDVRGRAGA